MFAAPAMAQTGSITGTIVDARDGTPLEKVSVRVQDTGLTTLTANDGRFQLDGVPAGRRELYVSSVDYILVRRLVDVPAGDVLNITIPIAAGTGTYSETVNVNSGADEQKAPSQQVLRSNELQQLRGVITNDPMRAIHVLPGVATGDDLRSEFTVRGLPVRNMNFTFEGIATPLLVHTVQGVQDTGSIAMVNGDVLNEIGLAAGSYPQLQGNHTGAELNFLMREGSRDRLRGQFRPSITDTSLVLEGPLGSSKSGSWLHLRAKELSRFGHQKNRSRKHVRLWISRRAGEARTRSHASASAAVRDSPSAAHVWIKIPNSSARDEVQDGVNDAGVAVVTWRYLVSPRFILTQKVAADANTFRNLNLDGIELAPGRRSDLMYRADWTYLALAARDARGRRRDSAGRANRASNRVSSCCARSLRCARASARRPLPYLRTCWRASARGARHSRQAYVSITRRSPGARPRHHGSNHAGRCLRRWCCAPAAASIARNPNLPK